MNEPTRSQRDAASLIFNLPGYDVIDAVDLPSGSRRVTVQASALTGACPDCGTASRRVHAWIRQPVKDLPVGGEPILVVVRKPRYRCTETDCVRQTFTQATEQLPARARCLTRLRDALLDAVVSAGRAIAEIAAEYGVAWWTVQTAVSAAAVTLPDVDQLRIREIGIDEHRFRRVRFFRDEHGSWRRLEPWMSTFVNTRTGQVLGIAGGRDTASIADWLDSRTQAWKDRIETVAIDPSAPFRSAIEKALPAARISVDHWHLVRLANLMLTQVRQRAAREQLGRRGRKTDLTWAHRMLLLRAGDRLSTKGIHRLQTIFHHDDPTGEISAAWAVKEQLRTLLAATGIHEAREEKMRLGWYVLTANTPETTRLFETITTWWTEIETFIDTRVTNARTEAANTGIKHIKRTGRGYRNPANYQTRILLRSAHQTRRRRHLTQQATTVNCE